MSLTGAIEELAGWSLDTAGSLLSWPVWIILWTIIWLTILGFVVKFVIKLFNTKG